jgi:hypothetical protein
MIRGLHAGGQISRAALHAAGQAGKTGTDGPVVPGDCRVRECRGSNILPPDLGIHDSKTD